MNIFNSLQNAMFATVAVTMGYDAIWIPSDTGVLQQARILFNGPTEKEKLMSANYDPEKLEMEYKAADFAGLKDLADNNDRQIINIDGLGDFIVNSVQKKFDGKTLIAHLKRVE